MNDHTRAWPALGAALDGNGVRFRAFVTTADTCSVRLYGEDGRLQATHPMKPEGRSFFEAHIAGVTRGALYRFVVGERELPDPHARYLPQGVHGPAMVMGSDFAWQHDAVARPLAEQILYELHVGTFTAEGTYDAARARLPELAALGITTLELMPLAAFAGARGWGYDGVALYAPFAGYGTPDALRRFIDEAHGLGLGVLLDVVYNHFGPSGNYLSAYSAEYFTRDASSAWGDAPNFAHPAMRGYVLDNARYWLEEFRFDGLRLDAVHAIHDATSPSIVRELASMVARIEPRKVLIAEDERNDPAIVTEGGVDAVWADDFHHQVRVTLTGETDGYYRAYEPGPSGIASTVQRGWLYEGQWYAPTGEARGKNAEALPASSFVYCIQNHDQVGNRALGERLSASVSLDAYCAASALLLFLPMVPLLFMGQEWAATSPFLYFTDHDAELGRAVSAGRRNEFGSFAAFADPEVRATIPDPQALDTFQRSRLDWQEREKAPHQRVLQLYRELIAMRKTDRVLRHGTRHRLRAEVLHDRLLAVKQWHEGEMRLLVVNFRRKDAVLPRGPLRGMEFLWTSGAPVDGDCIHAETALLWRGRHDGPTRT